MEVKSKSQSLFDALWQQYTTQNPQSLQIFNLLQNQGENVINDHIALRSFNLPHINIDVLAKPFLDLGFVHAGDYEFAVKKLTASHFVHAHDSSLPRVFISQLKVEEFSPFLQKVAKEWANKLPKELLGSTHLLTYGNGNFVPSFKIYSDLVQESEYAAWLYINGFRANHFTVSVNALNKFQDIQQLNNFLKDNQFALNISGGEVKGTPAQLLEQSSTLADKIEVRFEEGFYRVPGCYYEFAKRYPDASGKLYDGFIAQSADKIFESTDSKSQL